MEKLESVATKIANIIDHRDICRSNIRYYPIVDGKLMNGEDDIGEGLKPSRICDYINRNTERTYAIIKDDMLVVTTIAGYDQDIITADQAKTNVSNFRQSKIEYAKIRDELAVLIDKSSKAGIDEVSHKIPTEIAPYIYVELKVKGYNVKVFESGSMALMRISFN